METSQKSKPKTYQNLTSLWGAFRANLSQSPEREEASTILEELFSLKSPESLKLNNLAYFSLKTSKGYFLTMRGELSEQSSPRLMNWGMTSNGKCLTARISESHKTGKGSSLSDILEDRVDPKYFLSEKIQARLKLKLSELPLEMNVQDTEKETKSMVGGV
jgi:hypothetical protein